MLQNLANNFKYDNQNITIINNIHDILSIST